MTEPKQCECRLCKQHRRADAAIRTRNVDELIVLVNELGNELVSVGADAEYANAIIDGSWPSADYIIQHRRAKLASRDDPKRLETAGG